MIFFILVAGLVIKCTISPEFTQTYCMTSSFKEFGVLAGMGLIEMVYELRGIVAVFQHRGGDKEDEE